MLPAARRTLAHWWPLLLAVVLLAVLVVEATGASAATCNRPLLVFVLLAAPALAPYGLILSGLVQPQTGYRALWFLRHSRLAAAVGLNALFALAWCVVGAVWLFDAHSDCAAVAPALLAVAIVAWAALLLVNLPWALLLALPCLLACKCPIAFTIVAHMAGIHRRPDRARTGDLAL